jgi:hypothetical protein
MRFSMKKYRTYFYIITALTSAVTFYSQAYSMPGFARKHRMSCQTCHAPFPKLKPFGEEYAANGFRLPEGDSPRTHIDTGDDSLYLIKDFPIGMRMDVTATLEADSDAAADLKTPFLLKVISGAPVTEKLSYYFYFFFTENGEISGIEDAFYYKDFLSTGINITAGQFAVSDPIYKGELRLTYEPYEVFKRKPSGSHANLKYDRGLVIDYGFDFGLDSSLQIVNGNGIGSPEDGTKNFDRDSAKSFMGRHSQDLEIFRIGTFGYYGKENGADDFMNDTVWNRVLYAGGDASFTIKYFEVNLLYLFRKDSNGYADPAEDRAVKSHGVMAEIIFQPQADRSLWALSLLYNDFISDFKEAGLGIDYRAAAVNFTYLLGRNARFNVEYSHCLKDRSIEKYDGGGTVKTGLTAAF